MTVESQNRMPDAPTPAEVGGSQGPRSIGALRSRPELRRAAVPLLLALLAGVVAPLLAAALSGNLSIPHNDAWSYSRIAQTFGHTGEIVLLGWNRSALIGQFVVLGPLASSLIVQQVFVAILGAVCLLCVYDLLRPALGGRRAGFAVLVLALWPGFGLMATSFMPDIPALTAAFVSLCLGRRAVERDSRLLLGLALLAGLWGATIRAQSLAAPAAVLLWALLRRKRSGDGLGYLTAIVAGAVFCAAFLVFSLWHGTLPDGDPPAVAVPASLLGTTTNLSVQAYFTLALPLAPAVLSAARPWTWGRPALITAAGTAVAAGMAVHDFSVQGLFMGNYMEPNGAYAAVMEPGDHRTVIPVHAWWLVVAVAVVSGVLLAGLLVQQWRRIDPLVGLFTLVTVAGTIGTALTGQGVFDRYLVALAPAALIAALAAPRTESGAVPESLRDRVDASVPWWLNKAGAAVCMVVVAAVAFALTANAFAFDSARWRAASDLAAAGNAPARIDAGLEWLGFHSPSGVTDRHPTSGIGWEAYFSDQPSCYAVTDGLSYPGWTLERTVDYRTFLVAGTSKLYVYSTHAAGC